MSLRARAWIRLRRSKGSRRLTTTQDRLLRRSVEWTLQPGNSRSTVERKRSITVGSVAESETLSLRVPSPSNIPINRASSAEIRGGPHAGRTRASATQCSRDRAPAGTHPLSVRTGCVFASSYELPLASVTWTVGLDPSSNQSVTSSGSIRPSLSPRVFFRRSLTKRSRGNASPVSASKMRTQPGTHFPPPFGPKIPMTLEGSSKSTSSNTRKLRKESSRSLIRFPSAHPQGSASQ
jgi:hypothetical protein